MGLSKVLSVPDSSPSLPVVLCLANVAWARFSCVQLKWVLWGAGLVTMGFEIDRAVLRPARQHNWKWKSVVGMSWQKLVLFQDFRLCTASSAKMFMCHMWSWPSPRAACIPLWGRWPWGTLAKWGDPCAAPSRSDEELVKLQCTPCNTGEGVNWVTAM